MKHTKIVLLTAAVVMMTQALGLSAAAEEETSAQSGEESVIDADSLSSDESSKETLTSGDYSYTLDGDNATITKYNGSETAVTIPDKLDGHTVTTLGSGTFATKDMITSITIPATVDTINSSCFYGCTVLEQVSLAEGNTAFTVTDGVLFSANGLVNHAVMGAGGKAIMFTSLPEYFRKLFIGSNIWQTMGFNAIIFIAALTAISPEYYEAATMDGASRFQKILYIDLPLIMPTIILMLILQVGNIMNVGYEKAYLMQNGTNTTVSEIISTYVYKVGLQTAQYSFATAVGLFNSVVNFIILVITNAVAKKTSDISIF